MWFLTASGAVLGRLKNHPEIYTTNHVGMADCTESRNSGFADAADISILPYAYRMGLSLLLAILAWATILAVIGL
jgi:hypothetical protein